MILYDLWGWSHLLLVVHLLLAVVVVFFLIFAAFLWVRPDHHYCCRGKVCSCLTRGNFPGRINVAMQDHPGHGTKKSNL